MTDYFDAGAGSTDDSLAYYDSHRAALGMIVVAEVSSPALADHYPYCLQLRDEHGNRMFLSGATAGFHGDGPRAARRILLQAGFSAVDAHRVLRDPQVILRQPAWPPEVATLTDVLQLQPPAERSRTIGR